MTDTPNYLRYAYENWDRWAECESCGTRLELMDIVLMRRRYGKQPCPACGEDTIIGSRELERRATSGS